MYTRAEYPILNLLKYWYGNKQEAGNVAVVGAIKDILIIYI
jgi:hypothetical protein